MTTTADSKWQLVRPLMTLLLEHNAVLYGQAVSLHLWNKQSRALFYQEETSMAQLMHYNDASYRPDLRGRFQHPPKRIEMLVHRSDLEPLMAALASSTDYEFMHLYTSIDEGEVMYRVTTPLSDSVYLIDITVRPDRTPLSVQTALTTDCIMLAKDLDSPYMTITNVSPSLAILAARAGRTIFIDAYHVPETFPWSLMMLSSIGDEFKGPPAQRQVLV